LSASLSNGLVSAFREDEGQFLIQTTAAIAPGSSGGPLLNSQGRAVGITTSRLRDSGFGFAVGASDIQRLLRAPLPIAIALSELPETPSGSGDDELKPVRALIEEKKYSEALSSLQNTSAQTQTGYEGQLLLCEIKEKIPDYRSALLACDAAIQLKPDSAEAFGDKAAALLGSGDPDAAEIAALRATKLSQEPYYAKLLGLVYYTEEKYSLVARQLSADSKDSFELTLLEGATLRTGDKESFQKIRSKITTIKGAENGWQLYFDGAQAQRDLDFDTAREKFRKCDAEQDFIDPVCITSLASVEVTKGDRDAAKSDIDSAVTRYPRNHSVLSEAIFIDLVTGNSSDAKRLHRVLEALPREEGDDAGDCLYYYGINQAATAGSYCSAAIKGHEDNYVVWSNAAYVALDNGQYPTAFSYFAKARQLFDASKEKHTGIQDMDVSWGLTLGAFYGGDKKDAKAMYRSLKKSYPDFATMTALKQLPLVWSDATQELVSRVFATFK
ncbi:MAG TPA: trypsin-like peptidase domain-containing protein, partial [Nitrospira sp.]|nr:trypsin-like peptidase domain-containing protein [Nitrospira sp.]